MNNNENKHKIKPYIHNKIDYLSKEYSQRHSKMLVVRADARYPVDYDPINDNHNIMRSIAKTVQRFKRDGYDPAYAWVREQNRSKHPHYHVLFFLDGKKTQSSKMVFNIFNQFWKSTLKTENDGLINYCYSNKYGETHENGKVISRKDGIPDYIHRQISYMSKSAYKGEPKDGLRDFGMSRLSKSFLQ